MAVDPSQREALYSLFELVFHSFKSEDIENGKTAVLAGREAVKQAVAEELKGRSPLAVDETALVERIWPRIEDRLRRGRATESDFSEQVTRVVDRRIDQFLARNLKSKELAERISAIAKSEARLMHAAAIERLNNQFAEKIAQEVEKAVDDLLRSDALADRIRKVARDAAEGPAQAAAAV